MKVGLVGKPNVGKSTFFAAATLAEAEIADYPFTTIEANRGMAYVRVADPGKELDVTSTPRTGKVVGATRFVPIELIDVAGLVPGAHEGRGLGNRFLTDLAQADALIHVVDGAGVTDAEGNPVKAGTHDPAIDIAFLPAEIDAWILGILEDGWDRVARRIQQENRKVEVALAERLSGIRVGEAQAFRALREAGLAGKKPAEWPEGSLQRLAQGIRVATKPIIVALNKADLATTLPEGIPTSAQSELALGKAAHAGLVAYEPGDASFQTKGALTVAQQKGLDYIEQVLKRFGSTGVHRALEAAVFETLGLIPVFPVEDSHHLTDKNGRVLPDCHLVPKGTTARQLAYRVHTELGERFIRATDCRTKRTVGAEHELAAGDVLCIVADR